MPEEIPNYGRRANDYPGPNGEYRFVKLLQSEAARYGALFMFMVPLAVFIYQIKLDIALIKQNHEAHIEAIVKELEDQRQELIELRKDSVELQKQTLLLTSKVIDSK